MSLIIAAVLMLGGLGAVAVFVIAVPVLLGLMAFDIGSWRKNPIAVSHVSEEDAAWLRSKEDAEGRISLERSVARAFVILGGVFWGVAVFAGLYSYRQSGMAWSLLGAFVPFVATLATLILGWYYERITAVLLTLASVGVVYWGIIHTFEVGVWALVTIALIGPMLTAAVLFWTARREQQALELMVAARGEQLVPAVATESVVP